MTLLHLLVRGVLVPSAALLLHASAQGQHFETYDLTAKANAKIEHIKKPPTGRVTFVDVPFQLPPATAFRTQGQRFEAPTVATFPFRVADPTAIYILLSGSYVKREFKNEKVGEIGLKFSDGSSMTYPIVAWKTLRESWMYVDEMRPLESAGNPKLVNVYTEQQVRAGRAAMACLDMLAIDLGKTKIGTDLISVSIKDTSLKSVKHKDPSFWIYGMTTSSD